MISVIRGRRSHKGHSLAFKGNPLSEWCQSTIHTEGMCKFEVPKSNPKLPECRHVMPALKAKPGRMGVFSFSVVVMEVRA